MEHMIYYVEDDTNIRNLALYALESQGLEACGFSEAESFRQACSQRIPQLILLDIMLPGEDGLSVLAWVRNNPKLCDVPVMMLTAKGTEYDKVVGLDAGADDYLAKPFGMMELASRCKALLRRSGIKQSQPEDDTMLECCGIKMAINGHRAYAAGEELELTLKEYDLLKKLLESPGRVFTRPQLLEDVWGISFVGETRTVDTQIQTLRRKLNEAQPGLGNLVETVRGVGYRLSKESE